MFKRLILMILIAAIALSPLTAEAELSYEPYGEKEFPIWTMQLRRAESIFFGSLVLTLPLTSLVWSICENGGLIPKIEEPMKRFFAQAGAASLISVGISTADWIIGEVQS